MYAGFFFRKKGNFCTLLFQNPAIITSLDINILVLYFTFWFKEELLKLVEDLLEYDDLWKHC